MSGGWFKEGVAQYYQQDIKNGSYPVSVLKNALSENHIIPFETIRVSSGQWDKEDIPLKYTESASMYEFLIRTYGEEKINNIFYTDGDFYKILTGITNKTINDLQKEWLIYIKLKYS